MDMLKFLEKAEWVVIRGCGDHGDECLECEEERPKHKPDCQLKATIDALRSGRMMVVDAETAKLGAWGKNILPCETPFKKEQG